MTYEARVGLFGLYTWEKNVFLLSVDCIIIPYMGMIPVRRNVLGKRI